MTLNIRFRKVSNSGTILSIIVSGKYFQLNQDTFYMAAERKTSIDWSALQTPYDLCKDIGESVYVGTLDGNELIMQQMIKYPFTESATIEIGNRSSAHLSALGKVILAHLNYEEHFTRLPLKQATEQTFVDQDLFFHHLEVIKRQGFAFDDEERMLGVRCVAAPVFHDNKVIAALAIAGPTEHLKRSVLRSLSRKVIEGSKELSNEIDEYLS